MASLRKASTERQPRRSFTVDFLLQGAFFALEQAAHVLRDARLLYDQGRYASSFALSVLGREEIGRARIYLEKRKLVRSGNVVSPESLRAEVSGPGGHVRKITASQQIIGVPVSVEFWGDPPEPGSPEEKNLLQSLERKRRILEERLPKEAHQRKLRSLYVDPSADGSFWLRPIVEITQPEAEIMLEDAELRYTIQRRKLLNPADRELEAAVTAWLSKPSLLEF